MIIGLFMLSLNRYFALARGTTSEYAQRRNVSFMRFKLAFSTNTGRGISVLRSPKPLPVTHPFGQTLFI